MDLLEQKANAKRHPWETARVRCIRQILERYAGPLSSGTFLDVGSGDGFTIAEILKSPSVTTIHGIDIHLSFEQVRQSRGGRVEFFNRYEELNKNYDGIFLLDVVEHTPDDRAFLSGIKNRFFKPGGFAVITVPAFQSLFSSHDTFLKHYRRYNLESLKNLVRDTSLQWVAGGYLFGSLLPVRAINCCLEKMFPSRKSNYVGLGDWHGGPILTHSLETILSLDNAALISLARYKIVLPGLSVWAIVRY